MKLWLLRHARVLLPAGVCYGVSDVGADPQATAAAASAFAPLPASGSAVWCSPLTRARSLASALQTARPDLQPPVCDARLQEMDFGDWELHDWAQIPRPALQAWTDDFAQHRFGGKESTQRVIDRVADALDDLAASGAPEAVWVTHAGVIRAVLFLQQGQRQIRDAMQWPRAAPQTGEATWVML
jgi:alpha-ribazole phosphatase